MPYAAYMNNYRCTTLGLSQCTTLFGFVQWYVLDLLQGQISSLKTIAYW